MRPRVPGILGGSVLAVTIVLAGCGGEDAPVGAAASTGSPPPPLAPSFACAAGERELTDGTCQPAGVPPERCAIGFEPDDEDGCRAILPADACASGTMAVPGETSCHEVAPCGAAPWGDIDVAAVSEFVDASFAGTSDGTAAKPWRTIQEAMTAAAQGAAIAIAEGSYEEELYLADKSVRLLGRCPSLVEIVGPPGALAALVFVHAVAQSEVRSLAIRGAGVGLFVSDADVLADRVWLHDLEDRAAVVSVQLGAGALEIRSSLVERAVGVAVASQGADLAIDASVVRETLPLADGTEGTGVLARAWSQTGERAAVEIVGSVIERNWDHGVYDLGSSIVLEGVVVRDTKADGLAPDFGRGVAAEIDQATGAAPSVRLTGSVIERSDDVGLLLLGGTGTVDASVIRDVTAMMDGTSGRGIDVGLGGPGVRSTFSIRDSVVARTRQMGVLVIGSDATVESTIVRDVVVDPASGTGCGIGVQLDLDTHDPATLVASGVVVERAEDVGLFVGGADAQIDGIWIRDSRPLSDGRYGRGIQIQAMPGIPISPSAACRNCLVEDSRDTGVVIIRSYAELDGLVVRRTLADANDGLYGDGIAVSGAPGLDTKAVIRGARIEGSARAGLAVFGATAELGTSLLDCNAMPIVVSKVYGVPADLLDLGGNVCGCGAQGDVCRALPTGIAPPEPLPE